MHTLSSLASVVYLKLNRYRRFGAAKIPDRRPNATAGTNDQLHHSSSKIGINAIGGVRMDYKELRRTTRHDGRDLWTKNIEKDLHD